MILMPGYANFPETMDTLAAALEGTGRSTYIVAGTEDGTGDLREQAALARDAASQALADGAPSVDLVGFSAGGLAARWFVQELGGDAVTRRVLTLSSPHHGTTVVEGLECPVGCMQLSPDSDLVAALNANDETPRGPDWVATWINGDTAVVPPMSGRLRGATSFALQDVCPDLDIMHSEIPDDPTVEAITLAVLGSSPVERPGREVCASAP